MSIESSSNQLEILEREYAELHRKWYAEQKKRFELENLLRVVSLELKEDALSDTTWSCVVNATKLPGFDPKDAQRKFRETMEKYEQ